MNLDMRGLGVLNRKEPREPNLEGKSLWQVAKPTHKARIFKDPAELWKQCVRYFRWVELNGLKEEKLFSASDGLRKGSVNHMRAMTITGLSAFIGVAERTWRGWSNPASAGFHEDLSPIVFRVEQIIREQKFTGAASGMLNPLIIARDLGLPDKYEDPVENMNPVDSEMILEEKAAAFKAMLENSKS